MSMVWDSYFASLILLCVLPAQVYSAGTILSLYDNVNEDFKFIKEKSSFQDMMPIKVFLYVYENIHTNWCMQVVSFNLAMTEDSIDFFMVSCDLKGPFKNERGMIIIDNIAYLGIKEHVPIWALYVLPQGTCVQRRYTDHKWEFLEEIEEMDLTMAQCMKVIGTGKALKAAVSKEDVTALAKEMVPKIGEGSARIISMDDSFVDEYVRDSSKHDDREGEGDVAKMTVYHLRHEKTGECARFISINSIYTEDFLDFIVMTCDEENNDRVNIVDDMIEFADLVYVRDDLHEPIWAVFVLKEEDCRTGYCEKHCILKVYTDEEHFKLLPKNENKLTWNQCLNLMNHKDVKGFWNIEGSKPTISTKPRTYEEVVGLLQIDLSPPDSTPSTPAASKYVVPEAPGFQPVPQPAPPAIIGKQEIEDTVTETDVDTEASKDIDKLQSSVSSSRQSFSTPPPSPPPPPPPPPTSSIRKEEQSSQKSSWGGKFGGFSLGTITSKVSGVADNYGLVKKTLNYIPDLDEARKQLEERGQKLTQQLQQKQQQLLS